MDKLTEHLDMLKGIFQKIKSDAAAYLTFPTVTLIAFREMLSGKTNMAVPYHLGSIWPWRAEYSTTLQRRIIATDQADTYYPWSVAVSRSLRNHHLPFWNPNSFGGTPLWTNGQPSPIYPIRIITSFLMGPSLQHDFFILFHVLLAGFGMYFLCRTLRFNKFASISAGLFWMFSPTTFAWMQFEFFLPIIAYLPWMFFVFKEISLQINKTTSRKPLKFIIENKKYIFWGSIVQTLLILGSNVQFALLAIIPAYAYLFFTILWEMRRQEIPSDSQISSNPLPVRKFSLKVLFSFSISSAVGFLTLLLSATSWLPILIFSSKTSRSEFSYQQFVSEDRTVRIDSFWQYSYRHIPYPYIVEHLGQMTFIGTAAFLFGVIGFISIKSSESKNDINFARIIAVATLLIVTGTPIAWFVYSFFPGMQQLAHLGRALFFWTFALCILSARGIEVLLRIPNHFAKSNKTKTSFSIALATYALITIAVTANVFQTVRYGFLVNPPMADRSTSNIFKETPAIKKLKEMMKPDDRIIPIMRGDNIDAPPTFYTSHQVVYDINSAAGYESLVSSDSVDTWRIISGESIQSISKKKSQGSYIGVYKMGDVPLTKLSKVGVTLIFGSPDLEQDISWKKESNAKDLNFEKIYSGNDAVIYRIGEAPSSIYHSVVCENNKEIELSSLYNSKNSIIARSPKTMSSCSDSSELNKGSKVEKIKTNNPNEIRIDTSSENKGFLYLPYTYDDGWSASVDGKSAEIINANHSFMGIQLDEGKHKVKLEFVPPGFHLAWLLTLIGFGIIVLSYVLPAGRKKVKSLQTNKLPN